MVHHDTGKELSWRHPACTQLWQPFFAYALICIAEVFDLIALVYQCPLAYNDLADMARAGLPGLNHDTED